MVREGKASADGAAAPSRALRLAPWLIGCALLAGCTNTSSNGVSALVPPAALAAETTQPEETTSPAAEQKKLAKAPEVEVASSETSEKPAPSAKPATAQAATTAFAEPEPKTKRPSVAVAAKDDTDKTAQKPGGLFAAFLKSNAQAQAARNRQEAEQRLARLKKRRANRARTASSGSALPGVRTERVFGIEAGAVPRERRSTKKKRPPVVMASVAAAARGSGRHLARQHKGVSVGCLKPALVKRIRMAERHFGRRAVVTSGYRSPRHNRRVRGARRSMHMSCAAADVQISGISKWQLAKYFRKQAGRGGVGTYCHTRSVHVDIGAKRDWNWRCRRKKRRS